MLDQQLQGAGALVVGTPRAETVAVRHQQFEQEGCISRGVFGARGRERLAVLRQRLGRDGEEYEEVVLQERVDERAARLLQADGYLLSAEAGAQLRGPRRDCFGRLPELGALPPA